MLARLALGSGRPTSQRDLPFRNTPCKKGGVALLRRPIFEPLFTTHPSHFGFTSPWTLLVALLRGPLSYPICRQTIAFCGSFEPDSRCIGLVILSCLSNCHEMCHRIPWLTLATNCTWHVILAQVPCTCLRLTCSDVSSRPPCFDFSVMEGHISTISQFQSHFCPTYKRHPGVFFFFLKNWPNVTTRPRFVFCDIKRRKKRNPLYIRKRKQ